MSRDIAPQDERSGREASSEDRRGPRFSDKLQTRDAAESRHAGRRELQAERARAGRSSSRQDRGESGRWARLREPRRAGRRIYQISEDERRFLFELGRFRSLRAEDVQRIRYGGNAARMRRDVRSLIAQGLIERKRVWTGRDRESEVFYALTKPGKRQAAKSPDLSERQALYSGFVKAAELNHDAAIYPMFEKEARRIEQEGGKVKRVVLDYELKRKAYSPLAKARRLPEREYAKRQAEIAREHGLKIVNGHITLPDLRIEYETRSGASAQVDLEVASESYHGSHAAEKAAAGFRIYAAPATADRLHASLEEREITADLLYL